MKKITNKNKQRYFKLNRCLRSIKASLVLGPMCMLLFWYLCVPILCDAIWKDVVLMIGVGWIASVIYLIILWIIPVDLGVKRKQIEESLVQNALRIAEAEQRGKFQKVIRLKNKQEMLEIQNRVINM